MARNYAAVPHEYYEEMAELTDEEFGRLIRALLIYSMAGEEPRLTGSERFYARRVVMQEDRFQASYQELSEKRSEAGKKGAAVRWHGKNGNDGNTETKPKQNYTTLSRSNDRRSPAAGRAVTERMRRDMEEIDQIMKAGGRS